MQNIGRESTKDNDLFFTCSLIDYIARMTKNRRKDVVNALNKKNISKISASLIKSSLTRSILSL